MEYKGFRLPDFERFDASHFDEVELPVINEIVGHFRDGATLVQCQAPTGVGKSLVGECVRQALDTAATYSCSQLSLQRQFLNDFTWAAHIAGRSNYTPLFIEDRTWGNAVPDCSDCDWEPRTELCTYCLDQRESCPYTVAREHARASPLVCANYAYLLNEWKGGDNSAFSGRDLLVADEGSMLAEELSRHISVGVSRSMQRFLQLDPPKRKTVEDAWHEWFHYAIPHVERRLKRIAGKDLQTNRQRRRVASLLEKLREVQEHLDGYVYEYGDGQIEFKPVTVDHLAGEAFWQHSNRVLLMDATIISPVEIVESLGFEGDWRFVDVPSVYSVENRPIYFFPGARMIGKPEVQKENAWPDMAVALLTTLDMFPSDRVLVHTNSKALTEYLWEAIRDDWDRTGNDREVFAYLSSAEKDEVIAKYDATERAVLLAMSLERGFDGKGDRCRVVVLCKTMFPSLGSKQVKKRLYGTRGGQLWYDTLTIRSVVQATGRGVRGPTDRATTIILDSQFLAFFGKREDLFPGYWKDALKVDGALRFVMRKMVRERKMQMAADEKGTE